VLYDYERGRAVTVPLDPAKTPVENARAYFEAAKKDEAAARRAEELLALTEANLKALERELEEVRRLSPKELRKRLARRKDEGPRLGLRYRAPGGFLVLVSPRPSRPSSSPPGSPPTTPGPGASVTRRWTTPGASTCAR